MQKMPDLKSLLRLSAEKHPHRPALLAPGREPVAYAQVYETALELAHFLAAQGVRTGHRVGFCLPKSALSVYAIFGIMENGAAYVPLDSEAPESRNQYILEDCQACGLITSPGLAQQYADALGANVRERLDIPGLPLVWLGLQHPAAKPLAIPAQLAYILYTSGSTGLPKGVLITQQNALCFVEWAGDEFGITENDVFSSIAPFHFDLSVFDLFTAMRHGASVLLIDAQMAKNPMQLAELIAQHQISVWYSTPTTLKMMLRFGRMERHDHQSLRLVLFAGEVFPLTPLREIQERWAMARFYNLYGPTETNVCTFHPIPEHIPEGHPPPFPIGRACPFAQCRVLVEEQSHALQTGLEGELIVAGLSVMPGYLNLPERNAQAFLTENGTQWYRTGDIVRVNDELELEYVSRLDRMIKRHGYRIELGEVEAALHRHPAISEAGVISVELANNEIQIAAFYTTKNGHPAIPFLALKDFLAGQLPGYMIPDKLIHLEETPKTATYKINYPALAKMVKQP